MESLDVDCDGEITQVDYICFLHFYIFDVSNSAHLRLKDKWKVSIQLFLKVHHSFTFEVKPFAELSYCRPSSQNMPLKTNFWQTCWNKIAEVALNPEIQRA